MRTNDGQPARSFPAQPLQSVVDLSFSPEGVLVTLDLYGAAPRLLRVSDGADVPSLLPTHSIARFAAATNKLVLVPARGALAVYCALK